MNILRSPLFLVGAIALCNLGMTKAARAQTVPTEAEVAEARRLAEAGSVDYKNGDFAGALAKLERAYGLVKVPKLALWYARSLAKNGKLVESAECYADVSRLVATGPRAAEQRMAQEEAAAELEQLKRRIPQVTIRIEGATAQAVQVTIDGTAMDNSQLGTVRLINPGKHLIQATHGEISDKQELTISEGEKLPITLRLSPAATTAAQAPPPVLEVVRPLSSAHEPSSATSKPKQASERYGAIQRTAGWVAVGVGGVGLVVGTVTGILVLSKKSQLQDSGDCPDNKCTLGTQHDAVASYNSLRPASTAGFIVGAIGGVAGASLLLSAPKQSMEPSITAWFGPASAGVHGRF